MANSKGVGSPLDKGAADQLALRSKLISSQTRDKNILLFLNANKPWIKLSSGVNTLSDAEIEASEASNRLERQTGDSSLAKKHTLGLLKTKGGVSKTEYSPTIRSEKGAISSTEQDSTKTYRNYNSLGYRPEPGITSATVRSKGSYGVLRETTVDFIVWTLEDLDLVESLYLRPGYTMLLEWGHSLYFDNSESFQSIPFQFGDDFFEEISKVVEKQPLIYTQEERTQRANIEARVEDLRVKSGYNYDAVYGYVKNFSWNFRKDGGYACTISIASKGTVIESLRVDRSPMDFIPASELSRGSTKDYREQQKSIFHYFIGRLEAAGDRDSVQSRDSLLPFMRTFLAPLQDFKVYRRLLNFTFFAWKQNTHIRYIPLSVILDIVNNYLAKTKNGVQKLVFYTGQDTDVGQNYKVECKYTTSKYHFALDPTICLLAKVVDVPSELSKVSVPTMREVADSKADSKFEHTKGKDDDILNIYITDVMLKSVADSFIDSEQATERGILAFIEAILSKINDNLGGVNEISLNEEAGIYYIVDRKLTPETDTDYPELSLVGLKSTVTDLQISSKLSNQVGSQIAIAAQGIDSNYNENISELLTWNLGLVDRTTAATESRGLPISAFIDRYLPSISALRNTGAVTQNSEDNEKRKVWAEDLEEVYTKFRAKDYDDVSFDELKANHRDYCSKYVLSYQTVLAEPEKGIIPIELSFTLLGISGITIARAFKIAEGVLPTKYSKKFGFIITGLEHEIGAQWLTKVKTQFYILEQPSATRVKAAKANFTDSEGTTPNTVDTNVPGFTGPTPQADRVRAVLPTLGYSEKKKELSSGGDITFEMANATLAVLSTIKNKIPNLTVTLTGGNDSYHQRVSTTGRHVQGRGVDFVLSNPTQEVIKAVEDILLAFTAGNAPNFRYLNEYAVSTTSATGKHFHISWGAGTEGDTNLQKATAAALSGQIIPTKV